MIWSVIVTYEAFEKATAESLRQQLEELLEADWPAACSVSELAEVAPLVTDWEDDDDDDE